MHTTLWWESLKERELGRPRPDGTMLKWILKIVYARVEYKLLLIR